MQVAGVEPTLVPYLHNTVKPWDGMSDAHRSDLVSWPNGMSHPYSVNCALAHAGRPWCPVVQGPTLSPGTGRPPASSFQQRWTAPPFRPGAARLSSGWLTLFKSFAPFLGYVCLIYRILVAATVTTLSATSATVTRSLWQILIDRHCIHYPLTFMLGRM